MEHTESDRTKTFADSKRLRSVNGIRLETGPGHRNKGTGCFEYHPSPLAGETNRYCYCR
jgi:hypothetical protein